MFEATVTLHPCPGKEMHACAHAQEEEMHACAQCTFSFSFSLGPSQEVVPSTFRVDLSSSINSK